MKMISMVLGCVAVVNLYFVSFCDGDGRALINRPISRHDCDTFSTFAFNNREVDLHWALGPFVSEGYGGRDRDRDVEGAASTRLNARSPHTIKTRTNSKTL